MRGEMCRDHLQLPGLSAASVLSKRWTYLFFMMFWRWKVHRKAISQNRKTAVPLSVCGVCGYVCNRLCVYLFRWCCLVPCFTSVCHLSFLPVFFSGTGPCFLKTSYGYKVTVKSILQTLLSFRGFPQRYCNLRHSLKWSQNNECLLHTYRSLRAS